MIITVAAIVCSLASGVCSDEIVTDSNRDETLTLQSCAFGQPMIAKWMSEHPVFRTGYQVKGWRCVIGKYQPKGSA